LERSVQTTVSGLPFDDIRRLLADLPGPDEAAANSVRKRNATLTKPTGSLGRLEEIVEWVARWQGKNTPAITRPLVAIFAANHGIAARGVSAYPQSVTRQMVENFAAGGAAINQLCIAADLGLKVFELALDQPTPDIVSADSFDEKSCAATIAFGMEAVAGGVDLLCLGEMGIANTTVAAAVFHALYGGEASVLGRARHRGRRRRLAAQGGSRGGGCLSHRRRQRPA
jgi:nicotinate-nucleotide--dimethylbenzimidazole phosphoribosyltransferase